MTDKEEISQLRMKILELEDKNLTLKKALRDALNFAQETAVRAGGLGGDDSLNSLIGFLEETVARGLNLNEAYRGLLDD